MHLPNQGSRLETSSPNAIPTRALMLSSETIVMKSQGNWHRPLTLRCAELSTYLHVTHLDLQNMGIKSIYFGLQTKNYTAIMTRADLLPTSLRRNRRGTCTMYTRDYRVRAVTGYHSIFASSLLNGNHLRICMSSAFAVMTGKVL
jgi:hypothetical protein